MPEVTIKDLQPGDAVIFVNRYYTEDTTPETTIEARYETDSDYEDHIAMFSHFDKTGNPIVVHSIDGTEGYKSTSKPSGLVESTLQNIINRTETYDVTDHTSGETKKITRRYDVNFKIFRFTGTDPDLAIKALAYLHIWKEFRIPYDAKRLQAKIDLEDTKCFDGNDFFKLASDKYATEGKFRALKYAVRREGCLTQPGLTRDLIGRGLTCSMTFTLAFQVAELEEYVATINEINTKRKADGENTIHNSDKYAKYNLDTTPPIYARYLETLKSSIPAEKKDEAIPFYVNSLQFCRPGFDIFSFTHKSFPIDCKCIGVAGIRTLFNGSASWQEVGDLQLEVRPPFTEEERIKYRATRKAILAITAERRKLLTLQGFFGTQVNKRVIDLAMSLRTRPHPEETMSAPTTPDRLRTSAPALPSSAPRIPMGNYSTAPLLPPGDSVRRGLIFNTVSRRAPIETLPRAELRSAFVSYDAVSETVDESDARPALKIG